MTMLKREWARLTRRERQATIDWTGVPPSLRARATAVARNPWQAEDLVEFYGHPEYRPPGGVVLVIPNQAPVYIEAHGQRTALELRDLAANMWHRIIQEVRDDPDEGRFTVREFLYMPPAEQFRKLKLERLGRILEQANNEVLHPERQAHQGATHGIIVPKARS